MSAMTKLKYPDTLNDMVAHLRAMLPPDTEEDLIRQRADVALEVNRLKREKNAIILGHNYMAPSLYHSVPDYTGDSLGLSRIAAQSEADIIVFCGVRFMAETAKILNPDRTVLLPSAKGGCSLAEAITGQDVRELRQQYPDTPVVSYVNTYAEVKAETDICCTSSNAAAVVRHLQQQGHDRIIFLPDEYLARNVAAETGMEVLLPQLHPRTSTEDPPNLQRVIVGWHGRCEVHDKFTTDDIARVREQYPEVVVLAHPECSPEVVAASDFSGSTTAMIRRVRELQAERYLLLTECAMGDNIAAENPGKEMVRLCSIRCPHMNEVTLDETLAALVRGQYEVDVEPDMARRARASLERMIEIG